MSKLTGPEWVGATSHVLVCPEQLQWKDDTGFATWESARYEIRRPEDTADALKQAVELAVKVEGGNWTLDVERMARNYIETWGLIVEDESEYRTKDGVLTLASPKSFDYDVVQDIINVARRVKSVFTVIAASENDELVPVELLDVFIAFDAENHIRFWTAHETKDETRIERVRPENIDRYREAWADVIIRERRSSPIVALRRQRAILSNYFTKNPHLLPNAEFSWGDTGPTVETHAVGIERILHSHLIHAFSARDARIIVCSVCGTPFEIPQGRRRPRRGVRRYCSDECRLAAKRADDNAAKRRKRMLDGQDGASSA